MIETWVADLLWSSLIAYLASFGTVEQHGSAGVVVVRKGGQKTTLLLTVADYAERVSAYVEERHRYGTEPVWIKGVPHWFADSWREEFGSQRMRDYRYEVDSYFNLTPDEDL